MLSYKISTLVVCIKRLASDGVEFPASMIVSVRPWFHTCISKHSMEVKYSWLIILPPIISLCHRGEVWIIRAHQITLLQISLHSPSHMNTHPRDTHPHTYTHTHSSTFDNRGPSLCFIHVQCVGVLLPCAYLVYSDKEFIKEHVTSPAWDYCPH